MLHRFVQGVFRTAGQRFAVFVEKGAEEVDRRQFTERIDISCAETGNHIEVAVVGFDEGEEAGAVNTFTAGKDLFQISGIVDNKVEGFDSSVTGWILEVDMTDPIGDDEINDIFFGEIFRQFADTVCQFMTGIVEFIHCYLSFM